jgi:hypothetical protein
LSLDDREPQERERLPVFPPLKPHPKSIYADLNIMASIELSIIDALPIQVLVK